MNGLTLRISSDKKIKPIKRDFKREDLQFIINAYNNQDITVMTKLLDAETVEVQVRELKKIFNLLSNGETDTDSKLIIDIITYTFLNLKKDSPLLQSFLKFLSSAPMELKNSIQDNLLRHLAKMLIKTNLNCDDIANYSFTVSTCLENPHLSVYCFSPCVHLLHKFIEDSLIKCHNELIKEEAPIKKLSVISGIHSCVQAGISLCQKYPVNSTRNLSNIAVNLLCDSDLPLDTRAASGILAVHTSINVDKKQWLEKYNFILESRNDLGMLSFCSGLLNVLSPDDFESVVSINDTNKPAIYILHQTVLMIEERNASESGIVLAAARCILLISRCYTKIPHLLNQQLLNSFLVYLWGHIDHFMDAVRHLALSALSNVASIGAISPELGVYKAILKDLSEMPVDRRSKHAAISVLVSHVPVREIISQTSGLVKALFSAALASPSSNYALNSLEALICQDLKERTDQSEWFELWVKPLLYSKLSAPLEQLLIAVIRNHPPVLEHITGIGLGNSEEKIDVILTCLKIGRKFNLLSGKDDLQTWKGLVDISLLESCLYHIDDDVRLSCLSLIVETSKSTEEFTPVELNLIKTFFIYNLSTQDPAVRQNILAVSKKLLTRVRDSRSALERRQRKNARSEMTNENLTCILEEYQRFVTDFKKACFESIFPGSSPSRRSFALGGLALMKQLGIYGDYNLKSAEILFSCLLDSYEDNKVIARDLLSCYPSSLLNFENLSHVNDYIKHTLLLSSSIRPPDSISAGYYMSLLASFNGIIDDENITQSTSYFCLTSTLVALKGELQVAKESLLRAASSGPLYGHLFVIRHILQALDLKEIGDDMKWCSLIEDIIETAFECNDTVACIVNNSSPEGHIPMDFSYSESKKDGEPQVTSQMVLLCSWRTVKEVSLLLGELSERASIKKNDGEHGLLSEDQILSIGKHLTSLLAETKHRGAFEQAYIGFSKLAGRLWKCNSGKLHELPKKWLDKTLDHILVNEKLSATRRSAGIPFIVQGLICSELESGSCKSLHRAMSSLLKIAKEGSSEGKLHALNILRALYRGSSLGEAVGPYVAEGIATAINGFNSNTWAERNSSTLLLSALMSRVFGVPRGKSETLSWRNRMTGRLFFQRYPILYSEILSHLEASSTNHMYPALYPVLLLLGRLYPSSLEGTDSNLQLLKYVPFIMRCAESSVMKTRVLAATALASLIASSSYESQINELMSNISQTSHENHAHGYLLMVLKLIQQSRTLEDFNCKKMKSHVNEWIVKMMEFLNNPKHSFIAKDTCLLVIIHMVVNYFSVISHNIITLLKNVLKDLLFLNKPNDQFGCEVFLVHSSILLFLLNFKGTNVEELHNAVIKLLQSDEYDVIGMTLEFLEFISSNSSSTFCPDIHDSLKLEMNDHLIKHQFSESVKKSEVIGEILAEKIRVENHQEDLVKLLKCFQFFPHAFSRLAEQVQIVPFFHNVAKNSHRSVVSYALTCLNSFLRLKNNSLNNKDVELIVDLIDIYSQPEADHQCRFAGAELLANNFFVLLNMSSIECKLTLWVSAVRLILDENQDIRDMICTGLIGEYVPSKGLELFLQKFVDETPDMTAVFIGLFYWAVGQPLSVEDFEEGTVFDKGNINLNYEDLIINRQACKLMKKLFRSNTNAILHCNIEPKLYVWLASKMNFQGHSILQLISNYKMTPPLGESEADLGCSG
ncbi:tRNA (32-2'-O)-methyltransferase regulator THADA isoform X2 [Halyomorpha halys]|uniref:tRNA (32-2'-O)-methyltransferase regulator THADA isoform X2 n=1 Tax=Halyomorpha halys TaxID=286706 RepID=UPI0006D514F0|nr:thyroid adenoma-associated protein homolog isoform X2 [Halyomorpha halys]